jgi:hypothetical protein
MCSMYLTSLKQRISREFGSAEFRSEEDSVRALGWSILYEMRESGDPFAAAGWFLGQAIYVLGPGLKPKLPIE